MDNSEKLKALDAAISKIDTVCDISMGAAKEIKITDSFSVPAFAKVTVNPRTEGAYFVFGLSF